MTPAVFVSLALTPGLTLLPPVMDSPAARALLLAIALQESKLAHRKQIGGPARSYFQFERGGIGGVVRHPATRDYLRAVCVALDLPPSVTAVCRAIEFHDALAVCLARLLLWTLPGPLPRFTDPLGAWEQYREAWRPGKPHRETWDTHFAHAWQIVQGG